MNKLSKVLLNLKRKSNYAFFKDTFLYFGSYSVSHGLTVLSIPLFTYYLSAQDFGIASVFVSVSQVFLYLISFNLHSGVNRYYFEEKDDFDSFLGTILLSLSASVLLAFFLLLPFQQELMSFLNLPSGLYYLFFPFTIGLLLRDVFRQIYISKKESKKVSKANIYYALTRFIVSFLLVFLFAHTYFAKVLGDSVASVLVSLYFIYHIIKYTKFKFEFKHLKYALFIGAPLLLYSFSNMLLNFFDQWMINIYLGNEQAGLYSFAYSLGFIVIGIYNAIQQAASADFFTLMNKKNKTAVLLQSQSIFKIFSLACFSIIAFSYEIGLLLAGRAAYNSAIDIISIVAVGYYFYGIYQFSSRIIFYHKKNIYLSVITFISLAINITLNIIFIPKFGYKAAAVTTLISYLIMPFMGYGILKIKRLNPDFFPLKFLLKESIFFMLLLAVLYVLVIINMPYIILMLLKIVLIVFLFFKLYDYKSIISELSGDGVF